MENTGSYKLWIIGALIVALAVIAYFVFFAGPTAEAPNNDTENADSGSVDGNNTQGRVYVDELEIAVMESFPVRVMATVRGNLSDGCTSIAGIDSSQSGSVFTINIATSRPQDAMCTQALVPFERTIELDVFALPAGTYSVTAQDKTAQFTLDVENILEDKG
jgi:inhibitor of cysteine peptidase